MGQNRTNDSNSVPRESQQSYFSITHKFCIEQLEGYITAVLSPANEPSEIFLVVQRTGSFERGMASTIAQLLSLALQYGVPLGELVDRMKGVKFEPCGKTNNPTIPFASSLVDYLARWLELKFMQPKEGSEK